VSTAAPPGVASGGPGSITGTGNLSEGCPLCGAPLRAEQEWCLRCGAAARTRLAAAPNWRAPLVTAAVLVALALGVLAAALVKLAGDSGPAPPATTRTVTTAASATPTPGAAAPLTTTSTPSTLTPAPTNTTPSTSTPGTPTSSVPTTTTTRAGGALSGLGGGTQAGR
jgi:hypothetical protein